MTDERHDFLKIITAMLGTAALSDMAEAIQTAAATKLKMEPPIKSRILKREEASSNSVVTSYMEVELLGSNNTKQVFTSLSSKANEVTSTHMIVAAHADATDPTPTSTSEFTIVVHSKKLAANHSEVSGTILMPNGTVTKIGPMTDVRPANPVNTNGMTDEELLQRFLEPKLKKMAP